MARSLLRRRRSRLLYSANWDHFDPIRFWDALDSIGVSAYCPLAASERTASAASFERAWRMLRMRRILVASGDGFAVLPGTEQLEPWLGGLSGAPRTPNARPAVR